MLYIYNGAIGGKSFQESITSPEEVFPSILQFPVGSSSLGDIRKKALIEEQKKSSNHRMVWVGRDLNNNLIPNPL